MSEHYKNMILANAAITNTIYLTTGNKDGTMSLKRRNFTEEVLQAAMLNMKEHAESNGRAVFSWELMDGTKGTLAYIPDELHDKFIEWCEKENYSRNKDIE